MVYISKVYTRFGDEGQTMLASGDTVSKASLRVCAYGEVDELNAVIGMLRTELQRDPRSWSPADFATQLDTKLSRIQQELFNLGAELATPGADPDKGNLVVSQRHVEALEAEIDAYNEDLEPLKSFILPGGGPVGSAAHLARTVCRRAERTCIALIAQAAELGEPEVRAEARIYLNRLSDWCFVVARAAAKAGDADEVLWNPKTT